jgi:hypothetical protein
VYIWQPLIGVCLITKTADIRFSVSGVTMGNSVFLAMTEKKKKFHCKMIYILKQNVIIPIRNMFTAFFSA